jgi:hypothetical protein
LPDAAGGYTPTSPLVRRGCHPRLYEHAALAFAEAQGHLTALGHTIAAKALADPV